MLCICLCFGRLSKDSRHSIWWQEDLLLKHFIEFLKIHHIPWSCLLGSVLRQELLLRFLTPLASQRPAHVSVSKLVHCTFLPWLGHVFVFACFFRGQSVTAGVLEDGVVMDKVLPDPMSLLFHSPPLLLFHSSPLRKHLLTPEPHLEQGSNTHSSWGLWCLKRWLFVKYFTLLLPTSNVWSELVDNCCCCLRCLCPYGNIFLSLRKEV